MRHHILVALIAMIFVASSFALGQSSLDNAKSEKPALSAAELRAKAFAVTEQMAAEATNLELSTNRAFVFAIAADLLWSKNQTQAQTLFRRAASELSAPTSLLRDQFGEEPHNRIELVRDLELITSERARETALLLTGKHDPGLALELLIQTRDPLVAAEIQKSITNAHNVSREEEPIIFNGMALSPMLRIMIREKVIAELKLQNFLTVLRAKQNPERAAKLIRDNNLLGGRRENLDLARKVFEKDPASGRKLLAETIQAVIADNFDTTETPLLAARIVRDFGQSVGATKMEGDKQPAFAVDDQLLRQLANKIADKVLTEKSVDIFLEDDSTSVYGIPSFSVNSFLSQLEKVVPSRAAALKTLSKSDNKLLELFDTKTQVSEANETATNKSSREQAKLIERVVQENKYEQAHQIIVNLKTKSERIGQLVKLALAVNQKNNQDSTEFALKCLAEARSMVVAPPANGTDFNLLLQIIKGYVAVAPAQSFDLLEPLIIQTNELFRAAALLARYERSHGFVRSELPLVHDELLIHAALKQINGQYISSLIGLRNSFSSEIKPSAFAQEIKLLAETDFERTVNLANNFERADVRTLARLIIVRSLLAETEDEEKKLPEMARASK